MNLSALIVQIADAGLFAFEQTLELARDVIARLRADIADLATDPPPKPKSVTFTIPDEVCNDPNVRAALLALSHACRDAMPPPPPSTLVCVESKTLPTEKQ